MAVLHGSASDGYEFIADQVITIDEYNPLQRILTPLTQWRQFDDARGGADAPSFEADSSQVITFTRCI